MKVVVKGDSMWPTYNDGDIIECTQYTGDEIELSTVIVFNHPLKRDVVCVKRVVRIDGERLFVQGDNPDPIASEDSHNFGWISTSNILAIERFD